MEVDTPVKTIHANCVIRVVLGKQLHTKAALKLNNSTKNDKKLHPRNESALKSKFRPVGIDPVSIRQLRGITNGKQKRVTENDIGFHEGNDLFRCFSNTGSLKIHKVSFHQLTK